MAKFDNKKGILWLPLQCFSEWPDVWDILEDTDALDILDNLEALRILKIKPKF